MRTDKEKMIIEKAKSALIKLGTYTDDTENRDERKINDSMLEALLDFSFLGMHASFRKIDSHSIPDKDTRRLFIRNKNLLTSGDLYNIDELRASISNVFPALQEYGLIDRNEVAIKMMEEVYNDKKYKEVLKWEQDQFNGIRRIQPMSSKQWPFFAGVWRHHSSEYVIVKTVLDSCGIDVSEENVQKLWEEKQWELWELFQKNNAHSIDTDER